MTEAQLNTAPAFTLEDEADESSPPFAGGIIMDEITVKVKEDGTTKESWHLAVRPVNYSIGKTGAWHLYAPLSKSHAAIMQQVLGGYIVSKGADSKVGLPFKSVFGRKPDGTVYNIGRGELVGLVGMWQLRDITIKFKDGSTYTADRIPFLTGPATAEETTKFRNLPPVGTANSAEQVIERTESLPLDQVECLAELIVGNTSSAKALTAALSRGLPEEVIAELSNGNAARTLVEAGIIVKGEGGRYLWVNAPVGAAS